MVGQMETNLSNRVEQVCREKNLNANELSKELGVTSTAVYKIISGDTKNPSMDILIRFHQKLGIDMTWLATGEGHMNADGSPSGQDIGDNFGDQVISRVTKGLDDLKDVFEQELKAKNSQIASLQKMLELVLGKSKGVPSRPNRTLKLQQTGNQSTYALPARTF